MEHDVAILDQAIAELGVVEIAMNDLDPRDHILRKQAQIADAAVRIVVEKSLHASAGTAQRLDEMASDEAASSGDQIRLSAILRKSIRILPGSLRF